MTNLDELERLLAQATPGEWHVTNPDDDYFMNAYVVTDDPTHYDLENHRHNIAITLLQQPRYADAKEYEENAELIVALHNSAPAMIAELRAARAVCELITLWAGVEMTTLHPDIAKALRKWQKARDQ